MAARLTPRTRRQGLRGPVSLRQVSEAAGVSRMTASRAFQKGSSIRPEVRERVVAIAHRLGYVPDRMVSEIMSSFAQRRPVQYRETFAVLWWPERWRDLSVRRPPPRVSAGTAVAPSFYSELELGLQRGAARHGCAIENIVLTPKLSIPRLDRTLRVRNIQGVILTPPSSADSPAPALDWSALSAVIIGSSLREPALHRVQANHYTSLVHVLERMRRRGFHRPCLLVTDSLEERMLRAYTAAFLAWEDNGAKRIWHADFPDAPGLPAWLEHREADVVIADSDQWHRYVPQPLASRAFVSLNAQAPITGIYQHPGRIAESAVDLLVQTRLRHETGIPAEPFLFLAPGTWVEGETLPGGEPPESRDLPRAM